MMKMNWKKLNKHDDNEMNDSKWRWKWTGSETENEAKRMRVK